MKRKPNSFGLPFFDGKNIVRYKINDILRSKRTTKTFIYDSKTRKLKETILGIHNFYNRKKSTLTILFDEKGNAKRA